MKMKKKLRWFSLWIHVIVFLLTATIFPQVGIGENTQKALTIAVDEAYPPFSVRGPDGQPVGLLIDVWKLWSETTNIPIQFVVSDWAGTLESLRSGEADLHFGLFKSTERAEWMAFSKPLYTIQTGLYITNEKTSETSLKALNGQKVGSVHGTYQASFIRENHSEIELVEFPSTQDLLMNLLNGNMEALIFENASVEAELARHGWQGLVKQIGPPLFSNLVHAAVKKEKVGLLNKVNHGFDRIPRDALASLERHWIADSAQRYYSNSKKADTAEISAKTNQVALTTEERAWIKNHPLFRVAATPDWPPFEFQNEDGAYAGISADFIRLAAKKTGLQAELHFDKWRPLVDKLKNRLLDVAPGLNETDDRQIFLIFTEPFVEQFSVLFTTNDRNDIKTMADLNGKVVAVENGYALAEELANKYPQIKLSLVSNSFEAIQQVSLKQADAYVGNQVVGSYLIKKNMITNVRPASFWPGPHGLLRFGIRKDWPILRDVLQKGLSAITTEERNTILGTYIDVQHGLRQKTVSMTDEERSWVDAHKRIRISPNPLFPPIEFFDEEGVFQGYASELLNIAAERLGIELQIEKADSPQQAMDNIQQDKTDMVGTVTVINDQARLTGLSLTDVYQTFPAVIIVPASESGEITLEMIKGKQVATVSGGAEEKYLRTHYPDMHLITVPDSATGLRQVAFSDLDAFITLLPTASHIIQKEGITSLRVGGRLPVVFSLAFGVREDWPIFLTLLNKAIRSISKEEEKELLARWVSLNVQEGMDLRTVLMWVGGVGGISLLIVGVVVAWNRSMGREIAQRKKAQTELAETHAHLEEVYEEVSSSINYASRIQRSILPDQMVIKGMLSDYIVLWKPRDIVGGDIYWGKVWGNGIVVMLGDCTGHGVPGAFMSLITTGALDRACSEIPVGDLSNLMQRTHHLVQTSLGQHHDEGESDDGMELGLCYYVPGSDFMTFVSARFDLFVVHHDEVTIIKGTKKGIGYRGIPLDQEYVSKNVAIGDGRRFYMTSDGIIDQIGGERGRSFGKKRFRDLLSQAQHLPIEQHGEHIYAELIQYQGEQNRRDDVSCIGFSI